MASVAALLAMDRSTLTAALKPLDRRGLGQVMVDPQDRRCRLLRLRPAGRRLLWRGLPIWYRTHAGIVDFLPHAHPERPERLRDNLRALS
jgi:DNA-binding MarR family transcriptional regulator